MIKVVNRSILKQSPSNAVIFNVMRPSVLGNPFVIGKDGDRDEVIEKFRRYLWDAINQKNKKILAELGRIKSAALNGKNVYLMCCCKPANCHGDVIKRCIEWRIAQTKGGVS
jgi:hypothetical protein